MTTKPKKTAAPKAKPQKRRAMRVEPKASPVVPEELDLGENEEDEIGVIETKRTDEAT